MTYENVWGRNLKLLTFIWSGYGLADRDMRTPAVENDRHDMDASESYWQVHCGIGVFLP